MADKKLIYDFASKWLEKFEDRNINYLEIIDGTMGDECISLGFEMDCGRAFSDLYGEAIKDYEKLNIIIEEVTDIYLLGSAILSQWRYFNHWAYSGAEILEPKNREWFIIALRKLIILST
ncbi:MAG: hypothetical protein IJX10_07840 [Phascolarctobacterium sp.]|nr:hypothetical protein [Phascolarctobacterium sp.]